MKTLMWVAIILGGLFLVVIGVGVYWFSSIESVKLTAADFETGGSYSSDERSKLVALCEMNAGSTESAKVSCKCVSDKAGTDFSRYHRLLLVAGFEGDFNKMLALGMGAAASGVPASKIPDGEGLEELLKSCGLGESAS